MNPWILCSRLFFSDIHPSRSSRPFWNEVKILYILNDIKWIVFIASADLSISGSASIKVEIGWGWNLEILYASWYSQENRIFQINQTSVFSLHNMEITWWNTVRHSSSLSADDCSIEYKIQFEQFPSKLVNNRENNKIFANILEDIFKYIWYNYKS